MTMTQTKVSGPKPDKDLIISALRHYDRYLYGIGARQREAQITLEAAGINVGKTRLCPLGKKHCKHWRQPVDDAPRPKSRARGLTGEQWYQLIQWVRGHKADVRHDDTVASFTRYALTRGVPCNTKLMREALHSVGIELPDKPKPFKVAA